MTIILYRFYCRKWLLCANMPSNTHLFFPSFIRSFIHPFIHSFVFPPGPLRVEVTPPQLSVSPGTPVTLRCRAVSGEPPITLRWERADGRTLSSLATDTNGVLSISEATLLDGGPYRCVGTNAGERAEATSSLNVMRM